MQKLWRCCSVQSIACIWWYMCCTALKEPGMLYACATSLLKVWNAENWGWFHPRNSENDWDCQTSEFEKSGPFQARWRTFHVVYMQFVFSCEPCSPCFISSKKQVFSINIHTHYENRFYYSHPLSKRQFFLFAPTL